MSKIRISKILFLVMIAVLINGCNISNSNQQAKGGLVTGEQGITIKFLPNSPQDNYLINPDEGEPISVMLEVRNEGSYPQGDEQNMLSRGQIYLSGFDVNIIQFDDDVSRRLESEFLQGKSNINPNGGFIEEEFIGTIMSDNIVVDKYEPSILATVCYPYKTKASPTVCIDPNPFDTIQDKVCKIAGQNLQSQGAPIAITKIDQEASRNKIQFKITLKNVGGGDIIDLNSLEKCNPYGGNMERKDLDKVKLSRKSVGFSDLVCGPFEDGNVKLYNGEGYIICSLTKDNYDEVQSAYTTPLNIELDYGYRTTISKPIKISKIASVG